MSTSYRSRWLIPFLLPPVVAGCSPVSQTASNDSYVPRDAVRAIAAEPLALFVPGTAPPDLSGSKYDYDDVIADVRMWQAGDGEVASRVVRVNTRSELYGFRESLDPVSILAIPIGLILDGLRWIVVEDADSGWFNERAFDVFFVKDPEDDASTFTAAEEIVIEIVFFAIDNFIEGRLRDSLGGDGGEVAIQASLAALGADGNPLDKNLELLTTEVVKRRSALLLALEATAGKKAVEDVRDRIDRGRKSLDKRSDEQHPRARIRDRMKKDPTSFKDRLRRRDAIRDGIEDAIKDVRARDPNSELEARMHLDRVRNAIESIPRDELPSDAELDRIIDEAIDSRADETDLLATLLALSGSAKRDEKGIFEEVKIIQGLAKADHLFSQDFSGVRPGMLSAFGTAAVLLPTADDESRSQHFARGERVIYRGKVADLSKIGEPRGFALSVLALERDSDQVAQALEVVQKYADERDLSVNAGGIPVEIAPLAEALGVIAQKIAEDDVELKCIDLRFTLDDVVKGSGPPVLRLQPGHVLVSRNLDGNEFGALAIIRIRRQ